MMKERFLHISLAVLFAFCLFTAGCGKKREDKAVAKTRVTFTGPAGMTMSMNGKELKGLTRGIAGGNVVFKFEAPGYYPAWRKYTITRGQPDFEEAIDLEPRKGALYVVAEFPEGNKRAREAEVSVNGKKYGKTPFLLSDIPTGEYRICVELPGFVTQNRTVRLTPNALMVQARFAMSSNEGRVSLRSEPAGAGIIIDGENKGTTPYHGVLRIGKHSLELRKENYQIYSGEIDVTAGKVSTYNIDLQPEPGEISVETVPANAKVFFNDEAMGTAPLKLNKLPNGTHKLKLVLDGYTTIERDVDITAGAKVKIFEKMRSKYGKAIINVRPAGVRVTVANKMFITRKHPGRPGETLPIQLDKLLPGRYTCVMSHPQARPERQSFEFTVKQEEITDCKVRDVWIADCILYFNDDRTPRRGKLILRNDKVVRYSPGRGIVSDELLTNIKRIEMLSADEK